MQQEVVKAKYVLANIDKVPMTISRLSLKLNLGLKEIRNICRKLAKGNIIYLTSRDKILEKLNVIPDAKIEKLFPPKQIGNKQICKYCNTEKTKLFSFKRESTRKNIYVDETNRQWDSARCPDCVLKKVAVDKYEGMEIKLTNRVCKKENKGCGKLLPPSRYYLCEDCQPTLPDDIDSDLIYLVGYSECEEMS